MLEQIIVSAITSLVTTTILLYLLGFWNDDRK